MTGFLNLCLFFYLYIFACSMRQVVERFCQNTSQASLVPLRNLLRFAGMKKSGKAYDAVVVG
jgi:hypothetical protein